MWQRLALTLAAVILAMSALAGTAEAQLGYDRPGGDYRRFTVRSGDPAACAARCERESRCRAWSFSYPRTERAVATCWLKSRVTRRVPKTCCVSGVRGERLIGPQIGEIEFSLDRFGGDYRSFETVPDPEGRVCAQACQADGRCRAWTYVRPGYIGSKARCYLKNRITPPRPAPCCMSGVVR
jgi:hypothetical protein